MPRKPEEQQTDIDRELAELDALDQLEPEALKRLALRGLDHGRSMTMLEEAHAVVTERKRATKAMKQAAHVKPRTAQPEARATAIANLERLERREDRFLVNCSLHLQRLKKEAGSP